MQNKIQSFCFAVPKCCLPSPRSGKVVKTEWKAKEIEEYFESRAIV